MEQLDLHDWTFVPSRAASMASLCASRCTSPPPPVLEGEWHVESMPVLGSHSGVGPVSASALLHGLIAADNEHYFYAPPISRYSTSRQLQATALRVELAVGGDSNVILKIHRQSSCSSLGGISAGRFSSSGSPKAPLSPSRSWLGSDESNPKILPAHSQTGSSITGSTAIITGPGTTPPSSDNKGGPRAKHAWLWVIPSIIVVSLLALSNVLMRQQAPQRTPPLATSPTAAVPGPPLTCARLEPASGICLSTAPLPCMCAAD